MKKWRIDLGDILEAILWIVFWAHMTVCSAIIIYTLWVTWSDMFRRNLG